VLPLAQREKVPAKGWSWTKTAVTEDLVDLTFAHTKNNVGVALVGRSNGLIDVDLDWPESRMIADRLLSEWPAFGRRGAPRSHRLATCQDNRLDTTRFKLGLDKNDSRLPPKHGCCVAELRGNGGYTMFPGSVHPCGEEVQWEILPDHMPELSFEQLERTVGLIAFLAVMLRFYPAAGFRDEMCMALTGALLRSAALETETRVETVDRLVCLVAQLANDEEYRTRGKAKATWEKMQEGKPVTGIPRLLELLALPKECGQSIGGWIGLGAEADGRSVIDQSRDLTWQLNQAEVALESADTPIFQRGGYLVRVVRQDYQNCPGVENLHMGPLNIVDIEHHWLTEQLTKAAVFVSERDGHKCRSKPTKDFCDKLNIGRRGQWCWPVLKGIIESPTLRPDWSVVQDPGYDLATGLFLDTGAAGFERVPEAPTREDASAALEKFVELIKGFPFSPDEMAAD
jgi:Bifunctional DNA primase/polymerase, N-terminal